MSINPALAADREKARAAFAAFNAHLDGPITLGSDGEPELVKLTLACDLDGMRRLLEAGENPNVRGRNGRPAIFWASTVFKNEVLRLLIEHGADLNTASADDSPLLHAARCGDLTKTRMLLDAGADPNMIIAGEPLLGRVCEGKHHKCAALLIERGADVNARSDLGSQPIHSAARTGNPEMLEVLLAAEADIETRDAGGHLPLELAIEWGRAEAVKMLLAAGAALPERLEEDEYWTEILDGTERHEEEAILAIRRIVRAALLARNLDSALNDQSPSAHQSSGGPSPL